MPPRRKKGHHKINATLISVEQIGGPYATAYDMRGQCNDPASQKPLDKGFLNGASEGVLGLRLCHQEQGLPPWCIRSSPGFGALPYQEQGLPPWCIRSSPGFEVQYSERFGVLKLFNDIY